MATYVFQGSRNQFDNTELIDMLDGRVAARGQEIELSDEEAEQLKATGVKLREANKDEDKAETKVEAAPQEAAAAERPAGQTR